MVLVNEAQLNHEPPKTKPSYESVRYFSEQLIVDGSSPITLNQLEEDIRAFAQENLPDHAFPPKFFLEDPLLIMPRNLVDGHVVVMETNPTGQGGIGAVYLGWDFTEQIPIMMKVALPMRRDYQEFLLGEANTVIKALEAPSPQPDLEEQYQKYRQEGGTLPQVKNPSPDELRNFLNGKRYVARIYRAFNFSCDGVPRNAMMMRYLPDDYHAGVLSLDSPWKRNFDSTKQRKRRLEENPFRIFRSLDKLLQANEFIPLARVKKILLTFAAGLDWLHARGIQHLDVKPSNAMVDEDNQTRFLDFGRANVAVGQRALEFFEKDAPNISTVAFAAPENFVSRVRSNQERQAQDLYAFGITAFELLFKAVPFCFYDLTTEKPNEHATEDNDPNAQPRFHYLGLNYESEVAYRWLFSLPQSEENQDKYAESLIPPEVGAAFAEIFASNPENRPPDATTFATKLVAAIERAEQYGLLTDENRQRVREFFIVSPTQEP